MDLSPSDIDFALRSPDEVLAAVPYLLGFHPSDSVVLVGLDRDQVAFTARADLPPGDDPGAIREMTRLLARLADQQRITDVVIVGYGSPFHVDPAVLEVELVLSERGLGVRDALRVDGSRYWSYLCDGPECCPWDGREFDVESSEFAAAATFAGRVALPDREAMERQVSPVDGAEQAAMQSALEGARCRLAEALTSDDATVALRLLIIRFEHDLDAALTGLALGDRPDDTAVAWLATALTIEECCQWAWQRTAAAAEPLSGGRPRADPASGTEPPRGLRAGGGRAGGYLELWRHLTRRAAPSPAAAALLAYAAWLAGNGALAWAAVQRALVAPRYFPAKVMAEVLASGLPPHEITARMAVLRAHRRPGT